MCKKDSKSIKGNGKRKNVTIQKVEGLIYVIQLFTKTKYKFSKIKLFQITHQIMKAICEIFDIQRVIKF